MKVNIRIRTPKGQAQATSNRIKPFIINRKVKHTVYCNDDDNEILWEVEGDVRDVMKVTRNLNVFDATISKVITSKKIQKVAKISDGDKKELDDMMSNHTSVEIVKRATAEEMVEYNKTFWEKLKEKFKVV
jgi:hypothetical protein